MVKMELERNFVEIEIGDMVFEVSLSDKELLEFQNKYKQTVKEMEEIQRSRPEDEDASDTFDDLTNSLSSIYDALLGEGSYEKIYAYNGSILTLAELFFDILEAVNKEIENRSKEKTKRLERYKKKPGQKKAKK